MPTRSPGLVGTDRRYVILPLVAGRYLRHPLLGLLLAISISVAWQLEFAFRDARWPPGFRASSTTSRSG